MKIHISSTLLFFLSTTTFLTLTTAGNPPPPPSNDTDFIHTSCRTTLYPQTCINSLSGYSSAVQRDPGRLARVAINVTLSKTKHMAKYVSNLTRDVDYGGSPRLAAAVHDCHSLLADAVYGVRESLGQMGTLNGTGEALRFQISNVQTWMSAALTNLETCTDGFEDVAADGGGVKDDVCGRAVKVKEVTSNALALVNSFADTVQTP
ncbi:hypothetical protein SSX86_027702 [Deinandra increscens subsp. villosa]|uniref:pectinesterase n=1 Tax=Deinandra increscens subsp. villosa TaxID=3103831 RepID=A0AAP0GIZ7_9ASTR